MTQLSSPHSITGVILAGGQGRRMGGLDKGLITYQNRPLIEHIIDKLTPQVDRIIVNANRNIERYREYGFEVVSDTIAGFCGPLAGMLCALKQTDSDFILTTPCDSPQLPHQLRQRMMEVLLSEQSDIAVAHDGQRLQPVFCLIRRHLVDSLSNYLTAGNRKIDLWFAQHRVSYVDFSHQAACFINFNQPEDLKPSPHISSPIPLIGFSAFSGVGKTTLLCQLIPKLKRHGIRIGVIKHAHHNFDIDKPGKDSHRIREAGSQQMLIASQNLMALMQKNDVPAEPDLSQLIARLDTDNLDLILVEGFKKLAFAKIELHRPSLGKPYLYPSDEHIIAVASDNSFVPSREVTVLNLNDVDTIADYLLRFIDNWN